MDDYTPSTEDVRESYTYFRGAIPLVEHEAEFERWLNEVKAAAWADGANAGYADGAYGRTGLDVTPNPCTLTTEM